MTRSSATCISPRSRAAPTSSPASCSACRRCRSGAARSRGRASAWRSTSATTTARRSLAEKGELVCTTAVPVDAGRLLERSRRREVPRRLFRALPGNVWCHGDFAEWTEHGGMIIHGRSDATLNPGGVRIGTAEIYRQVEQMPEIAGGALHRPGLGRRRARRAVRAAARRRRAGRGARLRRIKTEIRTGASPRHVPARIVAVTDIPRTKSGKITELAVRDVVHGRAGQEQGGARQSRSARPLSRSRRTRAS